MSFGKVAVISPQSTKTFIHSVCFTDFQTCRSAGLTSFIMLAFTSKGRSITVVIYTI